MSSHPISPSSHSTPSSCPKLCLRGFEPSSRLSIHTHVRQQWMVLREYLLFQNPRIFGFGSQRNRSQRFQVRRRWICSVCRRKCISCKTANLQKLHLRSFKCDVLKCLFTPLWSEYSLKHWKHTLGFCATLICSLWSSNCFPKRDMGNRFYCILL